MFLFIGKPRSITDAPKAPKKVGEERSRTRIAIIDDYPFAKIDFLRSHEYHITELGDIGNLTAVESYPIVVCDIRGVGNALGSAFAGAYLIRQIRLRYPEKYIIAYSGNSFNAAYQALLRSSDAAVKKDADLEEWTTALDKGIETVTDPVSQWRRLRSRLIEADFSFFDIARLEDAFVRSLSAKNPKILQDTFDRLQAASNTSDDIKFFGAATTAIIKGYIELTT